jgi:hypothetical protein
MRWIEVHFRNINITACCTIHLKHLSTQQCDNYNVEFCRALHNLVSCPSAFFCLGCSLVCTKLYRILPWTICNSHIFQSFNYTIS